MEGAGLLVLISGRGVDGEPVGELGHVLRGDGQDVQEALVAPGRELVVQGVEIRRAVQAQDGVRDVQVVLARVGREREVVGREVAVKARERLGELVGLRAGEGGD